MTEQQPAQRPAGPDRDDRWAPWWVYLIIILGANYLRQAILPFDTVPEWAVVLIAITISGILFVAITAVHRIANQQR
jgi:hypothetical protein